MNEVEKKEIKKLENIIANVHPFYVETIAEKLIKKGYGKVDDCKNWNDLLHKEIEHHKHTISNLEKDLEDYKKENERLKEENEKLKNLKFGQYVATDVNPNFNRYKNTIKSMIRNHEDGDYIRCYINDLLRGNDITVEERNKLVDMLIINPSEEDLYD